MLKYLNAWKISKEVKSECKICIKHFSGTIANFMEVYKKPSLRNDPNHIILHVGTHDSILDRTSETIATSIVDLVRSIKGENCDASISNIILRTDNKKLSQKGHEVSTHLKELCKGKNIYLIHNTNSTKAQHVNKG